MARPVTEKDTFDAEDASYLGDPWREAGAMAGFEAAIEQGPALFLGALGAFVAAGAALFLLFWYLAVPRLAELSPVIPRVFLAGGAIVFLYIVLEYLGLVTTVYTPKCLLLPFVRSSRVIVRLAPLAPRFARLFGSTPDRMAHSAVQVSNAVTRATERRVKRRGPVLVLLPRCLQRPECPEAVVNDIENCQRCGECPMTELLALRDEFDGVVMAVLTGGSVVPAVVARLDPRAVIGVACERELIAGIYVVDDRPVVGVANQRPRGPCRATEFKWPDLRAAVELFARRAAEDGPD
ncbi:MAG: DUF116 domain-containing protein [candidate division Zixibacteria bacterium]|nr:DUF116 domain-containing protein [candidate division Zixibacteria bacterium]